MVARERLILSGVYGVVSIIMAIQGRNDIRSQQASTIFISMLWLGFVLAISFMEAWVKFKAPFLPRYVGFDIGRTVFGALIAVEAGLCSGLWLIQWVGANSTIDVLLLILMIIYLTQAMWLYPKLELRGQYVLYETLKTIPLETMTFDQQILFAEMQNTVQNTKRPVTGYHVVYVVGEVVKVVLLVQYVQNTLHQLTHSPP